MESQADVQLDDAEHFDANSDYVQTSCVAPDPGETPQISDLSRFLKQTRALLPAAVLGLFLLASIAFLYFAEPFAMPIVIALLLNFLLKPVVKLLQRARIHETLGALIVIVGFFGLLSFSATRVLHPAAEWAARAPETMSLLEEKYHHLVRRAQRISQAAERVENITKDATTDAGTPRVEVKQPVLIKTFFGYTKSFATGLIETLVLLFFMLAPGDLFMEKLLRVLPTLHDKKKAVEIADEVQQSISTFIFTITLINTVLGVFVGLATWAVGLPNPALWGVLAGALNFIPYFGPISGVAVLTLAGFITFDEVWRALVPVFIYLCLHGIESNLITPMILGRRLTLNPLVIFISLMFWTWLWGIPGALLSIPMLMMIKIFCDHFKPLAPIAEFLSG